jgi:23S rRNA (cytosine1962-C5)-methyltransferase
MDSCINPIEYIDFELSSNDSQRLFHGRGHAYPGLEHVCIDWISPVALITLYAPQDEISLSEWSDTLVSNLEGCKSVQVQRRFLKGGPFETLAGEQISELVAIEHGLKYQISLGKVQNTGLFLDMANGRKWLNEKSPNASVLNLFSYTCGFSVAAIAGGASSVMNIDMSSAALSVGRANHKLNAHDPEGIKYQALDIFKSWGRIKKHGPYDILVSDPPSFQKGSVNIQRDYHKVIKRIPELVKPGGLIMLCLNSPDLDDDFLLGQMSEHAPDCKVIEKLDNPTVFKEAIPGKGLKVYIFQYL